MFDIAAPEIIFEATKIALYLIPLYITNACAMIFGGGTPLDLGRNWRDGKPILGKGKTIKGTILGIACGCIAAALVSGAFREPNTFFGNYLLLGFLLSTGAIAGDALASFYKRRNNLAQGQEALFLDQLDFIFGGMIAASPIYTPGFHEIAAICIATLLIHKATNFCAYHLKLKKVPW